MYVVSIGNAFDGLHLVGPFDDNEEAQEYGDTLRNVEWAVVELGCPPCDGKVEEEEGLWCQVCDVQAAVFAGYCNQCGAEAFPERPEPEIRGLSFGWPLEEREDRTCAWCDDPECPTARFVNSFAGGLS
jgi:hypothetical protein